MNIVKKVRNLNVGDLYSMLGIPGNLGLMASVRPPTNIQTNVYYVNDNGGSDVYDGLSPDTPFKTILKARTVSAARINWSASGVPWANNDLVIIFPGKYDETNLVGGLFGIHVIGLGHSFDVDGESGVVIKPDSGAVWDASSWINMSLSNVAFMGASGASPLLQLDTFNRGIIQDCVFQGIPGGSATTTKGFETVHDVTGSILRRCFFNQLLNGIYIDVAAPHQFTGCILEDLIIMATETNGIYVEAGSVPSGTIVRKFIIGPTPTKGINDVDGGVFFIKGWVEAAANDPATGSGHYSQVYLNGTLQS